MGKIRRKFDVQFKIQVCERLEAGVQTMAEICHDNQLQRGVVEGWVKRYASGRFLAGSGDRQKELERENERLRAKIGEMTMTIDLLKKVETFNRQRISAASSIITSSSLAQYRKLAKPSHLPHLPTTTSRSGTK